MGYVPWPATGCSLAEARERTAERAVWRRRTELIGEVEAARTNPRKPEADRSDVEAEISGSFLDHLHSRRLVAYARASRSAEVPKLISNEYWRALTRIDWETSSAAEDRAGALRLHDVRVFPALLAPCCCNLLDGLPLREAFRQFVLGDPEVAQLGRAAVELAPQFASVFLEGRHSVGGFEEWPLAFERWSTRITIHPDSSKRDKFDPGGKPDPIEAVIAAEARLHRYKSLITLLRSGGLEARASPGTAGAVEQVQRAIWFHRDFSFDPYTGDILQDNPHSSTDYDRHIRRWVGVVLHKSAQTHQGPESDRKARSQSAVGQNAPENALGPPAPPFSTADVIALGSLSRALDQLVFRHPEVRLLCRMAISVANARQISFEEDAALVVDVLGHDEPVLPIRYFAHLVEQPDEPLPPGTPEETEIWARYFDVRDPPELQAYYDAVELRAETLIGMLQQQQLIARGHTIDGHLVQIAHSIWSHPDYYVHPPTGDIYEASTRPMNKKWSAVILEGSTAHSVKRLFHVEPTDHDGIRSTPMASDASPPLERRKTVAQRRKKTAPNRRKKPSPRRKTPAQASIEKAVAELWPNGVPTTMLLKTRDELIMEWQKRSEVLVVSSKTIRRFIDEDGRPRS